MIEYKSPGPVASRFLRSDARRRVILGPFGSGKSVACCVDVFRRAREQKPSPDGVRRSRWAIVRNTYPDLKNTTVKTWQSWWGDEFGQFVNVAPFEHRIKYNLPDQTSVDAEVIFLAMDQEADAKKFLSLELTGIYFNEVRELKRSVIEAGDGRLGRYPAMKDGGPSWYGMIADTNMPDEDHWLYDLAEGRADGWEFFRQPGAMIKVDGKWIQNPAAENIKNITPGYYTGQIAGKSDEWISVHLGAEYGRLPTEGAYFAEEMIQAERDGRITDLTPSPDLPVHTFWDIGMHDYMAIWLGQAVGDEWVWVGYYENLNQSLDHYVEWLNAWRLSRRVVWGSHVWPHDGFHRDVGILGGKTRAEMFASLKMSAPIPMPRRANISDWINSARLLIRKSRFDRDGCKDGLMHLRRYRREFNEARNVYHDRPKHDEHSHGADAFQIAAMGRGKVSNSTAQWPQDVLNWRFDAA